MGNVAEEQFLEEAVALLRARLPAGWSAELTSRTLPDGQSDNFLEVSGGSSHAGWLVEARASLTPRQIQSEFGSPSYRRLRAHDRRALIVIAPYLSQRARELLKGEGICYLDTTGNMWLVYQHPHIWVETPGATKAPAPQRRQVRSLRGPAAGNIVRVLVDVRPPYGVTDLSRAARVDAGYVTRVLEALASEALVERGPRGRVVDVDWPALLRRRAASVDLLSRQTTTLYVAPAGAGKVLEGLAGTQDDKAVVSGSFAAARLAPVTASALLVVYTLADRGTLSRSLGLMEVPHGGDVAFIEPAATGPFLNARSSDGLVFAAPSQVAVDCLSGTGRMPAEGEAVIAWMEEDEARWRAGDLDEVSWPEWVGR